MTGTSGAPDFVANVDEADLRTLLDHVSDLVVRFDPDGRVLYVNPAAETATRLPATAFLGRTLREMGFPEPTCDAWEQAIAGTVEGGAPSAFEAALPTNRGMRAVHTLIVADRAANGRVATLLSVSRDASPPAATEAPVRDAAERQLAVRALRASEARFRAALRATSDIVWTNDAWGKMVGEQPQWSAFTGQSREEYQGYGWSNALHPDDAQPTIDAWNEAVESRTMFEFEHRVRRRDGVYRTFVIRAVPVIGESGDVREWVGVHTDVTERRRAEAALAASEHQLSAIANNATLALFVLDERQHCVYMNPAAESLTGYALHEMKGRRLHDVIHHSLPDGRGYPRAECPIERAFPLNRQQQGQEYFVRRDGTFYPVAFTASPVRDSSAGGVALGTIIEARDITSEQEAEAERMRLLERERRARAEAEEARAEAERANQAKSEFLAVMSHELRTPLNAIGGHAQILELGIHGPLNEAQQDAIMRIDRSQKHLLRLINDVLNLARVETGRVAYELREVPLAEAIEDLWPMIGPQLAAKKITFDVSIPDGALVRADREKLQQILLNLIGNAVKFTPENGHIWIDTADHKRSTGVLFVRITDTGPGIPPDKLESIFEPFFQVDSGRTRRSEGAGLGLTISRDLARGMGGDLRARSVHGVGSTFTITLRRSRPPSTPAE